VPASLLRFLFFDCMLWATLMPMDHNDDY